MRKAVFIYSPACEKYHYPMEHPFSTSRAGRVRKIVKSMGLLSGADRNEVTAEQAERIVLKKFHSARYLHALKTANKERFDAEAFGMGIGTQDCPVFEGMYEGAALACGATLAGANLILEGQADIAFNPAGGFHHAHSERASGFCYINDVALGCTVLAEAGKKVLYIDVDVHHGDGVVYAFYDRADVMTISFHQNGKTLFPGTGFEHEIGEGEGKGYCVNVPLPLGTFDEAYLKAFEAIAVPLITAFNPDVIVLQAGADGLAGDPLAHLYLTNNVYAEVIEHLLAFNKPILATGGGGYDIDNTVRAWALAWSTLVGGDTDKQNQLRDEPLTVSSQQRQTVTPAIEATIEAVKKNVFGIHGL